MNLKPIRNSRQITLWSHLAPWFALTLLSLVLSCLIILLGDVFSMETVDRFIQTPIMFIYNWLPLFLVMSFLYALTCNLFIAFSIGGGLFMVLSFVNKFKLLLRGDPLIPADLVLGGEVAAVVTKDSFVMTPGVIFCLVLFLLTATALAFWKTPRLRFGFRIPLCALCLALMYLSYTGIYCHTSIYNDMPLKGSIYSQTDKFRSRGFVFSFMINVPFINTYALPEGYSARQAEQLLTSYEVPPANVSHDIRPDIIVIMDEAFFDVDRIPSFDFAGDSPVKNYHTICEDGLYGHLYTSAFGGGTANTEFSFLTGVNSWFFSGTTIYSTLVRKNIDALPRMLKDFGYYCEAFHPGDDWFYNRKNVFAYMGFDNKYFKTDESFAGAEKVRNYITNAAATDVLLQKLDAFKSSPEGDGTPYFGFMVMIENHGPYATDKNLTGTEYFQKPDDMTEDVYLMINNYLSGLKAGDEALGDLSRRLEERDDPVVLVYFGDHLPFWGNDSLGYDAMHYPTGQNSSMEAYLNTYRIPFFIWSNQAAKEAYQKEGIPLPTGNTPEMTACYLPLTLLDYVRFPKNNYFSYLADVQKQLSVVTGKYNKTADGSFTATLPENLRQVLDEFEMVCNYKIFDEKIRD